MPGITVSETDNEPAEESSSAECMRPPNVAGISIEGSEEIEQGEEILEGDDGVRTYFYTYATIEYL